MPAITVRVGFAPARSAAVSSAPDKSAPDRFAPDKFAAVRTAPVKFAPGRCAAVKFASIRFASDKFATNRSAPVKSVCIRLAPVKSASCSCTSVRSAFESFDPERSVPVKLAPDSFAPTKIAPRNCNPPRLCSARSRAANGRGKSASGLERSRTNRKFSIRSARAAAVAAISRSLPARPSSINVAARRSRPDTNATITTSLNHHGGSPSQARERPQRVEGAGGVGVGVGVGVGGRVIEGILAHRLPGSRRSQPNIDLCESRTRPSSDTSSFTSAGCLPIPVAQLRRAPTARPATVLYLGGRHATKGLKPRSAGRTPRTFQSTAPTRCGSRYDERASRWHGRTVDERSQTRRCTAREDQTHHHRRSARSSCG